MTEHSKSVSYAHILYCTMETLQALELDHACMGIVSVHLYIFHCATSLACWVAHEIMQQLNSFWLQIPPTIASSQLTSCGLLWSNFLFEGGGAIDS